MNSAFFDAAVLTDQLLRSSTVLNTLGEPTYHLMEKGDLLSQHCNWLFSPCQMRQLQIRLCDNATGNFFFLVEIRHVELDGSIKDAFLLDQWMRMNGVSLDPYPFILASYSGSCRERFVNFIGFLERMLTIDVISSTLRGQYWPNVPFNWGAIR